MLPTSGSVLGIDVGWSLRAPSSAACRLDWNRDQIQWTVRHFSGHPDVRAAAIAEVAGTAHLLACALDGPLRGDLAIIDTYRRCERDLTHPSIASRISQPGSSRSPVGRLLNHHTNEFARLLLQRGGLARATHPHAIHDLALVEAFPTSFLGLMHTNPEKGLRQKRSDRYYEALVGDSTLARLLARHLPARTMQQRLDDVTNHDDRAALICAITALGVASTDYTTVGDEDGWIILPPLPFIADWAQPSVAGWNHAPVPGL